MKSAIRLNLSVKNNVMLSWREKMRLTQAQAAKACGVTLNIYAYAESMRPIGIKSMQRIADAMEMPVNIVFPQWAKQFAKTVNQATMYFLIDAENADKILAQTTGSPKLLQESLQTELQDVLKTVLTAKQFDIVCRYFGLFGHYRSDLKEIAKLNDLTIERVRQIVEKALRTVRHHSDAQKLKDFMQEHIE